MTPVFTGVLSESPLHAGTYYLTVDGTKYRLEFQENALPNNGEMRARLGEVVSYKAVHAEPGMSLFMDGCDVLRVV